MNWDPYFRALAHRYGWTLGTILDLTPRQVRVFLENEDQADDGPKFTSMEAALNAMQTRRELGL